MPSQRHFISLRETLGNAPTPLLPGIADTSSSDEYDARLREYVEDRTDDLLSALYDHIAPALAECFAALVRHSETELDALLEIARSVGIETTRDELTIRDAAVERITWQPVARSATLALFNWLLDEARPESHALPAAAWAREATDALDFAAFRKKTSLSESDARIAVGTAAQAVVAWEVLATPQVLLYRDRYASVWADATSGTIGALTTEGLPLVYVPVESDAKPVIREEDDELIHVELDQDFAELKPIAPVVGYSRIGDYVVVSSARSGQPATLLNTGISLKPTHDWSYETDSESLRVSSEERIAFAVPHGVGIHQLEGGLLLERNISKDVSLAEAVDVEPLPGISVGEHGAGDAEVIAYYIDE